MILYVKFQTVLSVFYIISIWNDYINFIKGVEAVGWYAKKQKLASLRSLYQRGIKTPITGIDSLWKDYLELEHRQDPIHAEKTRLEFCKSYARPRHVANMFAEKMKGINKNAQSVPPNGSPRERKQVELWWKYIGWEIGNPLRTEDTALYTKRVHFAFEQCLLCMGHHPDVWLRAARHLEFSSKILVEKGDLNASNVVNEQVAHIFGRAIAILNRNMFLYFAYADFEEGRLKYEKVHEIYSKYLDIPGIHPTLAYIQYMKFARRAEGLESARKVFKRARDDPRSQYHIFVYAALMEWHYSTDKNTAFRTLELGFKKFGGIPEYVTSYIDYLSHLNENNNTRQLFEKILSSGRLGNENSIDIWNKFLEFESNVGDLPSIVEVKKRRVEVLSKIKKVEGKATAQLVDKYRFLDLYPGTPKELENIGYSEVINVTGVSGMNTFLGSIIDQAKQIPLPKPDYGQMIPYKPKKNALPGDHPVPGGSFPLPPLAADLCKLLPPPDCFQGPFVHVDKLMDIFNRLHLPEKAPTTTENGFMRFFAIAKSGIRLDESDCRDLRLPPKNDIYRKRQRKN
ncbi:unnamed protein product [Ceutorhynchus assimilis]|uniref:Suppressor of forked domain-containing protein n=1 Tax=Ceutorhynchus assimilis TaxID=467358 RepID=A0A9P0DJ61_9CUCU|nr:unnamed protein product [Ceutorhynchus assimilis]